jgi:hypothetical protein
VQLYDLYSTPNIVQVIKSKIVRWVGHVACMWGGGRGDMHTGFSWGNLKVRDHLEDLGVDGRIILKWIFMN